MDKLKTIGCPCHPTSIAFHPSKAVFVVGLVDGSVQVHVLPPTLERDEEEVVPLAELKEQYCSDSEFESDKDDSEFDENDSHDDELDTEVTKQPANLKGNGSNLNDTGAKEDVDINVTAKSAAREDTLAQSINVHSKSCRAVQFSSDGDFVYTGSADSSICCLSLEYVDNLSSSQFKHEVVAKLSWTIKDACNGNAVNCLLVLPPSLYNNQTLLVSGDDEGTVRFWDVDKCRKQGVKDKHAPGDKRGKRESSSHSHIGCVSQLNCHRDYVAEIMHDEERSLLITTSGDCTLCVIDVRKAMTCYARLLERGESIPKTSHLTIDNQDDPQRVKEKYKLQRKVGVVGSSDDVEDELLCLCTAKGGTKLVVGTQQGVLCLWSWGKWDDMDDRFTGHPSSVDALLKVDEDTVVTGSIDGFIRIVQLFPHKFLGGLGSHDGNPVEVLKFSHDRKLIASLGNDNLVALWDASILSEEDEEEEIPSGEHNRDGASTSQAIKGLENDESDDTENSDNDSDDDDEDDDDDSEQSDSKGKKRFKTEAELFFSGL